MKRHANRKPMSAEIERATRVIREAYPDYDVVWGSHGAYGGHRAPRDHTLAFRLRDHWGKYHSNVIWISPGSLRAIDAAWVRQVVEAGTSHKPRSRRR